MRADEVPDDSMLLHYAPGYDPVKAREYYLRTRKLKGRKKGSQKPATLGGQDRRNAASLARKINEKPAASSRPKSKGEAQAQVKQLEAKLDRLRDVLAELVKAAKKRSGIEVKDEKGKKDKKSSSDNKDKKEKPMTAAERKAQAERAKERRDKEKKSKPEPKQSASEEIKELQEKIADVRAKIKKAIEDAKKQSNSKTAPKGR